MDFLRMIVAAIFAFLIAKAVGIAVDPGTPEYAGRASRDASRLMVPCATCGVYILADRAIRTLGRAAYCSAECSMVGSQRA